MLNVGDIERIILRQGVKLKSKFRKVVTGDPKHRVRDKVTTIIRENKKKPKYILLLDKLLFTAGVVNIPICQFFMLTRPDLFWVWYSISLPLLMIGRFIYFKKNKWQYFLLDFCYFTQFLTFLMIYFIKNSPAFFNMCFI